MANRRIILQHVRFTVLLLSILLLLPSYLPASDSPAIVKETVHYIVLNNVFYLGRDYFYMGYIDEKTFIWLEQDLAHVPEGSTLFVAMHISGRLDEEIKPFQCDSRTIGTQTINISSLFEMLKPYKAHLLTGHMHYNRNMIHSETLYEHNTGTVSDAWWQGDYCLDGTPVGYGVYEVDGADIVANIWNWARNWKVEWFEDEKHMGEMNRFEGLDPEVKKAYSDKEKLDFKWIEPVNTDHLFRESPKKKNSEISMVATDSFWRGYKELISKIRYVYGHIPVFCVADPMIDEPCFSYVKEFTLYCRITEQDKQVYFAGLPDNLLNETDDLASDWHPSYKGQLKIAKQLLIPIATAMNWSYQNN